MTAPPNPPTLRIAALLLAAAGALAAPAGAAASPLALLRGAEAGEGTVLLTLEAGPEGLRILAAHRAPVRAKRRSVSAAGAEDIVLAVADDLGEPLLVAAVSVPWLLHGPELDEEGEMRCRAHRLERTRFVVKLPDLPGAREISFHALSDHSPRDGAGLATALRADPSTAGLVPVGRAPWPRAAAGGTGR